MNRSDAAKVREMTKRILRTFDAATPNDALEGASWYERANELALALSAGTDLNEDQCAGVIAALSPRCTWSANARGAVKIIAAATRHHAFPVTAGTLDNRRKAWKIATGHFAPDEVLAGPKVRSFWANICGDTSQVTVDVWAARVAEGKHFKDRAPEGRRYTLIAEAFSRAADLRGVAPRDMQATCWTAYRRQHGKLYDL